MTAARKQFSGIFTPLITPINPDESIDLASLRRLVSFQIDAGVRGLWAMGTSGEFAGFDESERAKAIATVVDSAAGRVPVIANVSDASTRLAIRHARQAVALGAVALAATPPYYFPHSQDEVYAHFDAIRTAVDAPLFIYNIPQTVRTRVELNTARDLVAAGVVQGIKDSQNDLEWFRQLALYVRQTGAEFALFAGTRHLIDAAVLVGGDGAIPSIANAFPRLCVAIYEAACRGDYARSAALQDEILEIEAGAATIVNGSRNAATLALIKARLYGSGILAGSGLTSPLRQPSEDEVRHVMSTLGDREDDPDSVANAS